MAMSPSYLLGLFFILIVSILWTLASVVVQHLYQDLDFNSPFVLVYIGTSLFSIFLPFRLIYERRHKLLCFWRKSGEWRRVVQRSEEEEEDGQDVVDDEKEEVIIPWSRRQQPREENEYDLGGREGSNDATDDDDYGSVLEMNKQQQKISSSLKNNDENSNTTVGAVAALDNHLNNNDDATTSKTRTNHPLSNNNNNTDQNNPFQQESHRHPSANHCNRQVDPHSQQQQQQQQLLTHVDHIKIASIIAPLWFTSNYFYGLSLQYTSITSSTVLASTGSLFTFLFATMCGDEHFTAFKATGVFSTFVGSVLTGWNDAKGDIMEEKEKNWTDGGGNGGGLEESGRYLEKLEEEEEENNMNKVTSSYWNEWIKLHEEEGDENESVHYPPVSDYFATNDLNSIDDYKSHYSWYWMVYGKSPRPSYVPYVLLPSTSASIAKGGKTTEVSVDHRHHETIFIPGTTIPPPQDVKSFESLSRIAEKDGEEKGETPKTRLQASRKTTVTVPTMTGEFPQDNLSNNDHNHNPLSSQQDEKQNQRRAQQQQQQKQKRQQDDEPPPPPHQIWGDLAGLFSAMGYGTYTVLLRTLCPQNEDLMSMSLMFGYVGVLNMVLLMPVFLHLVEFGGGGAAASAASTASVHLTTTSLLYVIGKGMLDNVLSDYLWARAVVLTSATVATVGLGLTIPLAFICDILLGHGKDVVKLESVVGALCVLIGFVFVNVGDGCGAEKHLDDEENGDDKEEEEIVLVGDEGHLGRKALLEDEQVEEGNEGKCALPLDAENVETCI